jgi:hypothetical protein
MQKKNTKIWKILLLLPVFFFLLSIVLGLTSNATSQPQQNCFSNTLSNSQLQSCVNNTNTASTANKGFSVGTTVSGGLAVIFLFFGTPFWVVFLVKANNYNKKQSTTLSPPPQGQYTLPNPQVVLQAQGDNEHTPPTNTLV